MVDACAVTACRRRVLNASSATTADLLHAMHMGRGRRGAGGHLDGLCRGSALLVRSGQGGHIRGQCSAEARLLLLLLLLQVVMMLLLQVVLVVVVLLLLPLLPELPLLQVVMLLMVKLHLKLNSKQ